jgi:Spy/CpxP family protein refolding chaperone
MKKSMLLALLLGAALASSPATMAQEKKEGEKGKGRANPEERLKQLAEALKLTDEQKTKLEPILKEEGEKLRAIFSDANASREEKGKKMQEARKDISAKVKAVLTPEQAEKYEKLQAEIAAKRKKQ